MTRPLLVLGLALVPAGWALSQLGMTGHMAGHMVLVAVAAPLIAFGVTGTRADPAGRWPRLVTPMAMMLLELVTVWGWHLPAMRNLSHHLLPAMMIEQASFLIAGVLLWSAVVHARNRAAGIGALLLTTMHMTLLGVLIGLAPRPLYHAMPFAPFGLDALADQQLGGVVMLTIGAGSYLAGALALLAGLLRAGQETTP